MDDLFSVTTAVEGDLAIIIAVGEFDLLAVATFTACAEMAVQASRGVVVDLANVSFMDSSGLNALLLLRHDAHAHGGSLTLRAPTDRVRRLFDVAGLVDLFDIAN